MTNLVSISNSTLALLGKMRDEIGQLHRDRRRDELRYDVLLTEAAELKLKCNNLEFENSALDNRIHQLYDEQTV